MMVQGWQSDEKGTSRCNQRYCLATKETREFPWRLTRPDSQVDYFVHTKQEQVQQ